MWCVWVIDLLTGDVIEAMTEVTRDEAELFKENWYGDDSLVVLLPAGFCVC